MNSTVEWAGYEKYSFPLRCSMLLEDLYLFGSKLKY